jgi:hypothetical protein
MSGTSEPPGTFGDGMSDADESVVVRRYHLGAVAEASSRMEALLRGVFSALLGSRRANVVAAGQSVTWLAENALAMIEANDEVRGPLLGDPEDVARFRAAIANCLFLYKKRSRLIHGTWVDGLPDGRSGLSILRSTRRQPWPSAEEVKPEDVESLAEELNAAVGELFTAMRLVEGITAES